MNRAAYKELLRKMADGGEVTEAPKEPMPMTEDEAKSELRRFMDVMAPKVMENMPVMAMSFVPKVVQQMGEEAVKRYEKVSTTLRELSKREEKARMTVKDFYADKATRDAAKAELAEIQAQQPALRQELVEALGVPPVKRAEGSPPEGEEVDPESVGEARDMPTLPPAVKMFLGDVLLGWGENRGMLEEDISQEQRDWFIQRALEAKAQREAETGEPVTELYLSKWDTPTSPEQVGGFFSKDPEYSGFFSPAYQLRNYLGDTNVSFLPDGSIVTRNETYDFSPEYDKKSLLEWIKDQGLIGAAGKIGAEYGTREDTGKAVKRDIKWR